MRRTRQDVYASSLLRAQDFGYPLRNPRPKDPSDFEGLRVGDVGYVDENGQFNPLSSELHSAHRPLSEFILDCCHGRSLPRFEQAFQPGEVIMAGAKRILDDPRADYAFSMTSSEGAILILPDGASRWELDEEMVKKLEKHVKRYALQICEWVGKDILYLVTAVVKSKSWTLGSFCNGSGGSEIFVRRSSSNGNGTFTYQWVSETNVDNQQGPQNNHYLNQTVLLKGFKIMRRGGWLPSIALWARERGVKFEVGPGFESRPGLVETCIDLLPEQWVTPASVELNPFLNNIPFVNLPQSQHQPPHTMDRNPPQMNPKAQTVITHDNDRIMMLDRNTYPGSYPVDIGEVQSLLPPSSDAVLVTNDHNLTRHELNEKNDPFPDPLAASLNSLFSSLSENDSPSDLAGQVTRSSSHPFASGGFGDIYRGDLNRGGRLINVAIKTVRVYLEHDDHLPKKMKQFRREIAVWSKLKHPHILPLLGIIKDPSMNPDIPAMVCPWIENGALTTYLEKNHDLTVGKRFVLAGDIAHGLRYLHSRHVVHGDLSGSNVLVDGNGRACIADFGLSTLLTRLSGSTFATTHQVKGTMRWMAPELLNPADDSQVTPSTRSDVYSFGSIMLQILTGRVPYHHLSRDEQVVFAIVSGTRPGRPDGAAVTDRTWEFIEWCWSPTDASTPRPSSNEVAEFTWMELAEITAAAV